MIWRGGNEDAIDWKVERAKKKKKKRKRERLLNKKTARKGRFFQKERNQPNYNTLRQLERGGAQGRTTCETTEIQEVGAH